MTFRNGMMSWTGGGPFVPASMFASIQEAIDTVSAAGGGTVLLAVGVHTVTNGGGSIGISMKSNVTLMGVGYGTVLKLAAAADAHVINCASGVSNIAIRNLRIDGTRSSQTLPVHGIRVAGVDGLTVEDVWIHDAAHYGIGVQDGTNKDITLRNLLIWDTGGDGIDLKNKNDDNEAFVLDTISVRNWGLNGALTSQAAIDLRGPCLVSNVWISSPAANDATGVRFRQGELLDSNGLGAHKSSLSGFWIDMGATTSGIGLNVVARDDTVTNGRIKGGLRGVLVQDSGFKAANVVVEGASDIGWLFDAGGAGLDGDDASLTNCAARACGLDGLRIETDRVQVFGFEGTGNTGWGGRIIAGADTTKIFGGNWTGNTAGTITDAGTGTVLTAAP